MNFPLRYIARFLIEAETPLAVGSGKDDLFTDSPVALDCNGLPMIPGTGLRGVLRHALEEELSRKGKDKTSINDLFGYQEKKKTEGCGSRLVVSDALMVGKKGKVIEGLQEIDPEDDFYSRFFKLPVRQHCRINERGAADTKKRSKFNNRVVYKGCRFVFEMELTGNSDDSSIWEKMLELVSSPFFHIGGGTRKGYGSLKVKGIQKDKYLLERSDQRQLYLERSSSLAECDLKSMKNASFSTSLPQVTKYLLKLEPDDFFLFGAGFGDQEVDMKPVCETCIRWVDNLPEFEEEKVLIPASSIKGALSHRTAFHYNRLQEDKKAVFADKVDKISDHVSENNLAVQELFGRKKEKGGTGRRGRVIISDLLLDNKREEKILNHVSIDRFTNAPIDGALFNERVFTIEEKFLVELLVEGLHALDAKDKNIQNAFETALVDIATGMLPLGGGVMRGHGVFTGTVERKDTGEKTWKKLSA